MCDGDCKCKKRLDGDLTDLSNPEEWDDESIRQTIVRQAKDLKILAGMVKHSNSGITMLLDQGMPDPKTQEIIRSTIKVVDGQMDSFL